MSEFFYILLILLSIFGSHWITRKVYKNRYKNIYRRDNDQRLNAVYFPAKPTGSLHLYTVATNHSPGLDRLVESCKAHGIGIHVLGLSNKWQGFGNKWLWTAEYIKLQNLPAEAIVAFVDAYDVLTLSDPDEIIGKFKGFNAGVVFSSEIHCYPDPDVSDKFPLANSRFKYLNSGGAIGYAEDMVRIIDAIDFKTTDDDQRGFIQYLLSHPGEIQLDYQCEIFLSLFGVQENDLSLNANESRVSLLETDQQPCFIHGNGTSVELLHTLHQKLPSSSN